ncbi:response regulator [bacterium]|nr:MAG: response regulator [bacterium]
MIETQHKEVWLVDDDAIHNMALEILIRKTNKVYQVQAFTQASEALEHLKSRVDSGETPPAFLFLDLNMNEMNGWEFLESYAYFPTPFKKQINVFMLSSSVSQSDRNRAVEIPDVYDFIIKPLTHHSLQTILV